MAFNKETGMYEGFIYCITNKVNDKQYIGQTRTTIEKRYKEHKKNSFHSKGKDSKPLYIDFQKYGKENFYVKSLYKIESINIEDLVSKLNQKEKEFISSLNTIRPNGYNVHKASNNKYVLGHPTNTPLYKFDLDGNFIECFSSIEEAQISLGVTIINKKMREACSSGFLYKGYRWSYNDTYNLDYLKNKIEICPERGKSRSKKVFQFNLDGDFIKEWDSIREAAKSISNSKYNATVSPISSVCNGKMSQAYGYIWSYSKQIQKTDNFHSRTKKVKQYDKHFKYIRTYSSVTEACNAIGGNNVPTICNCCKGKINTAYGFMWRFVGENDDDPYLFYRKNGYMRCVDKFDLDGNYLCSYENMVDISEEYIPTFILKCCNNKIKSAYGYVWRFNHSVKKSV